MRKAKTIFRDAARIAESKRDTNETKTAAVMIASAHIGPNIKRISKFLKIPRRFVSIVSKRLRKSGVWSGGKIRCNWADKHNGGLEFNLDLCVGLGWLNKV